MKISKLLVPADFEIPAVKSYAALNRKYSGGGMEIREFYGSLNPSPFGVTKNPRNLKAVGYDHLKAYCGELEKYGFQFNYILNFLCYGGREFSGEGVRDVLNYAGSLREIGIRRFTVANPVVARAISLAFPDIRISVSIVQNTGTKLKLKTYTDIPGVDRVYISEDAIRDFETIGRLREEAEARGVELATLLNSFCLIDCPYKVNHANVDGHLSDGTAQDMPHFFYAWCSLQKLKDPMEILRLQAIRPEEIALYEKAGVSAFKIAGRELVRPDFLKTAEGYLSRHYEGNLMDLLTDYSENFFNEIYRIDNRKLNGRLEKMIRSGARCRDHSECEGCTVCREYLPALEINEQALTFYRAMFRKSYENYDTSVRRIFEENHHG